MLNSSLRIDTDAPVPHDPRFVARCEDPRDQLFLAVDQYPLRPRGDFAWDPTRICEKAFPSQSRNPGVTGFELKREILAAGLAVERAQILVWLYDHPSHIPEPWKDGQTRLAFGDVTRWGRANFSSQSVLSISYVRAVDKQPERWLLRWHWLCLRIFKDMLTLHRV